MLTTAVRHCLEILEETMRSLIGIILILLSASAFAKSPTSQPVGQVASPVSKSSILVRQPTLGIQEHVKLLPVSLGILSQPLPAGGNATLPRFSFGWMHVNEGFFQAFEGKLALSSESQIAAFSYSFGVGPRKGMWHIGMAASLGYAHLYDEAGHAHGLHFTVGPTFNFTLPWLLRPEGWRFALTGGWAGFVGSGDFKDLRGLKGFVIDLTLAFGVY